MALTYVHGKWLFERAVMHHDPIAIMVKRLWSAERDPSYQAKRRAVVDIIGRKRWNVLYATRKVVGKEAFYRGVYDAIEMAEQGPSFARLPTLSSLP